MRSPLRLTIVGLLMTLAVAFAASSASAASLPFTNWNLSGTLTVKKLNQSVTLPAGSRFNGSVDLSTGALTGDVTIPEFTTRFRVLGLPVDATLDLVEAGPATGHVTLGSPNITIDGTSALTIKIGRLSSPLLPLNLAGGFCQTSSPASLPLHYVGPLDLASGFTFSGTTTIPPLEHCGLATPLLNTLMAGSGNPFTVKLSPPS